jgi:hypothetical protein
MPRATNERSSARLAVAALAACLAVGGIATTARAKDPWTYGFVSANVTCTPQDGQRFRMLVTSQVFAFCASDISSSTIASQEADKVVQAAKVGCGPGSYEVTYQYVDTSSSRDQAAKKLDNTRQNTSYQKFMSIYASEGRYSQKCK